MKILLHRYKEIFVSHNQQVTFVLCFCGRFKDSGNANDVALRKSGVIYAAFGSALSARWRSSGTCTIMKLTTTDVSREIHIAGPHLS